MCWVRNCLTIQPYFSYDWKTTSSCLEWFSSTGSTDLLILPASTKIRSHAKPSHIYTVLGNLLDKHAPIRKMTVIVRPSTEWYTSDIHEAKTKRRRLEQRWRKSKLAIDYDLCANQNKVVRGMVTQTKSDYYSEKV